MKSSQKQHFVEILKKYRAKKASPEEIKFLEAYYNVFEASEDLITEENEASYSFLRDQMKTGIDQRVIVPNGTVKKLNWFRYAAGAAAAVLLLSVSVYFFKFQSENTQDLTAKVDQHIKPGGNKAVLTLANGQQIILNDATTGEIAKQSGISITKSADGQIVYTVLSGTGDSDLGENTAALKNTITTPKGGQYKVILPDGTEVLLNSASSLVYPTTFRGPERLVELTGEAYFEVAKDKVRPFRVKSGPQTVEVLGTHFNINAYDDETEIKTTLLEGAVKVGSASQGLTIAPGQQAVLSKSAAGALVKRTINTDKEIAWKDGKFSFDNDDIKTVMRSIARWYDVDIHYQGNVEDISFSGEIFRTAKLSEVFKILELSNVQLDVKGKTILVSYQP
ncbi:MAG: FecR domain-containing protein [Bacteroidota bacterium]